MIKWSLLGASLSVMLVSSASAEIIFQGTLVLTAATNCHDHHLPDTYLTSFHPRAPGNKDYTGLSTVHPWGTRGYGLSGADFAATFKDVYSGGIGWGDPYAWTGAQIRITAKTPAAIVQTTRFVTLTGQIKKPNGDLGVNGKACIISFEAAYTRDPRNGVN